MLVVRISTSFLLHQRYQGQHHVVCGQQPWKCNRLLHHCTKALHKPQCPQHCVASGMHMHCNAPTASPANKILPAKTKHADVKSCYKFFQATPRPSAHEFLGVLDAAANFLGLYYCLQKLLSPSNVWCAAITPSWTRCCQHFVNHLLSGFFAGSSQCWSKYSAINMFASLPIINFVLSNGAGGGCSLSPSTSACNFCVAATSSFFFLER